MAVETSPGRTRLSRAPYGLGVAAILLVASVLFGAYGLLATLAASSVVAWAAKAPRWIALVLTAATVALIVMYLLGSQTSYTVHTSVRLQK